MDGADRLFDISTATEGGEDVEDDADDALFAVALDWVPEDDGGVVAAAYIDPPPLASCNFKHSAPPSDRTKEKVRGQSRGKVQDKGERRTVSIQSIHSRKLLLASVATERPKIRVKLFVAFTIMLSSKAFVAPRPVTLEGFLFIMGANMTCERQDIPH